MKKTVGKKNATKDEVIQWVAENYPDTKGWLDNLPKSKKNISVMPLLRHILPFTKENFNENYFRQHRTKPSCY